MTDLEKQVCTFEQAKIFKDEFGLELESYFVWIKKNDSPISKEITWTIIPRHIWKLQFKTEPIYPAYSCAELGVMLPSTVHLQEKPSDLPPYRVCLRTIKSSKDSFYVGYFTFDNCGWSQKNGEYEPHAKSDLLIDGLRKGYIKPGDLKL